MGNELFGIVLVVGTIFAGGILAIHDAAYGNQIDNPGFVVYSLDQGPYPSGWYPVSKTGDGECKVVNDSYEGRTAASVRLNQTLKTNWTDSSGLPGWEAKTRNFYLNTGELYCMRLYYKADVESALYAVARRPNDSTRQYEETSYLLGIVPPAANWTLYVSPVFLGIENCVSVRQVIRSKGTLTTDAWDFRRL
ncbi:MAG TPA: hypothetical protein P5080_05705 [Candidatus Paceibacterota bacterium]|nr:hypothetical protein [Candidatus Pacearchaeota archaeon]HRZ51437.1 hypothetical protein [Candidatus Paceibacterota bacterium]HSA37162.1 hypothetical protein [Candidatus Paceibacterota bacterium]